VPLGYRVADWRRLLAGRLLARPDTKPFGRLSRISAVSIITLHCDWLLEGESYVGARDTAAIT
jgi:hypothetical protein